MNAESFAEWLRRQGYRVFRTPSSYWYTAGPRVLQAFPFHWLICPGEGEIRELMVKHGMVAVRYSTPISFSGGKVSYHIGLQNPYDMNMLKAQARNGIKRGLSSCQIQQISFERLATEGWALQRDTLERQNRLRSMRRAEWERTCRAAADLNGFEAWAAVVDGELAAAVIVCRIDRTWDVPYALSHHRFLPQHVNNALFYSVSRELLARENTEAVFFTVQSLDAPPTVDDFKFRMGLVPKPVRQRVDFHPWLKPAANELTHSILVHLLRRDEGNPFLAKAEGMLRFHLEGKQAPETQDWPECVSQAKSEFVQV